MVLLGSEVRLLAVGDSCVIGVVRGTNDEEILVTSNNSVVLYGVKSQKPLTSWSTSFNHLLRFPSIYDVEKKCFMTIVNGNVVRKWTATNDRIEDGTKITLPSPVFTMFNVDGFSDILLVHENGKIGFLYCYAEQYQLILTAGQFIQLARVLKFKNQIHVFIVTARQSATDMKLHYITFDLDGNFIANKTWMPPKCLIPYDVQFSSLAENTLQVAILWPDGSLSLGIVKGDNSEIQWRSLNPLTKESLNENVSASMTFLKNNIIFLFINQNNDTVCLLYSMKFESPTMKKVLRSNSTATKLSLYYVDDKVFMGLGSELLLIPHTEDKMGLSKVLGVHVKEITKKTLGFEKPLTWTNEGLEEVDLSSSKLSQTVPTGFSAKFLDKVSAMESAGKSEQSACGIIFQEILDEKDFDTLLDALKYYRNIPEATLVNALKCYLSETTDCQEGKFILHPKLTQSLHPVIDYALSIPLNDIFMLDHLRRLTREETMFFLQYLKHLLEDHEFQNELKQPDVIQVVDWISMLLDAHFHQLIVMKNEHIYTFLKSLYSVVNLQCKCLEGFVLLHEFISLLLSQERVSNETAPEDYGIEMMIFE